MLRKGTGANPHHSGCVMQYAVYRLTEGLDFSDSHPCFNGVVTYAAQYVNDGLTSKGLEILDRDFSPRLDRCRTAVDPKVEHKINVDLYLWLFRRVEEKQPQLKGVADLAEEIITGRVPFEETESRLWVTSRNDRRDRRMALNHILMVGKNRHLRRPMLSVMAQIHPMHQDETLLDLLDEIIERWEKTAANLGALGNPLPLVSMS